MPEQSDREEIVPMATTTYQDLLQIALQLTPAEQQKLVAALGYPTATANHPGHSPRAVQPLTDQERASVLRYFAELDALAEEIDAITVGDMDAVAAIREQRRDV